MLNREKSLYMPNSDESYQGAKLKTSTFSYLYLLLLTVAFFWGTSYGAAKVGLRELVPMNLAILRFVMASIIFGTILLHKGKNNTLERKDIPQFVALGFLAITSFFYIQFTGLKYTSSAHAGLILAMTPVLVALYAIVLGTGQ